MVPGSNLVRTISAALLGLLSVVTLATAFNLPQRRTLTLADRLRYQRAIEEVYWRHRIWPKENSSPKPPLDEVVPSAEIEKKVGEYLRNSQALEDYWQRPIIPGQLQAEMERIASHTKQPAVLREIFTALNNDPFVIAECLARPVLAERLLTELYAHDHRFHRALKQRAEADLRTHGSVTQTKQTSGTYSEIEWIKSDSTDTGSAPADEKSTGAVKMNSSEWQESVEKLVAQFHSQDIVGQAPGLPNARSAAGAAALQKPSIAQIQTRIISRLQEDDAHYYVVAVTKKGKERLKLATIAWLKEPLRSWLARSEVQVPVTMAAAATYALPVISNPSVNCADDTWTPTSTTNAPLGRAQGRAVWTGSEMIVWGGHNGTLPMPSLNTGGRYNPITDSWTATSTTNAPSARSLHTAVWTGSQVIVWGGDDGNNVFNTGGRYDPGTDSWTATSTTNAPAARSVHTAVWTGTEMVIWGGVGSGPMALNTGGRYNPGTDSWTATSTAGTPSARINHTAVWTGSEMIIWGGVHDSTGGRYNPSTNNWTATSIANAPADRFNHTAIWTGNEMIVWGGVSDMIGFLNTGGRYDPSTNSWTATSTANAPTRRDAHSAIWTGSEMIVWAGFEIDSDSYVNTGASYDPNTDRWTATSTTSAPAGRGRHTAVWTGSQMIVWSGEDFVSPMNTGGRYCVRPASPCVDDTWSPTSFTNAPTGRTFHTAVWTGSEMIVWGGVDFGGYLGSGGRYDPTTDSWTATSTASAPDARETHTAVWTGSQMIVWGGYNGTDLNTGGRYNPGADSWTATSAANAPTARDSHTAVWTGSEMIVWGGFNNGSYFNTGGRYNPITDNWAATSTANAPDARALPTAMWTGSEMIAWGGFNSSSDFNTGGRYNPSADSWTATSTTNAPAARDSHTAVWTGTEMIVWGGETFNFSRLNTGGRYSPGADNWIATSTVNAPTARDAHTAVLDQASEMIVWGGFGGSFLNTGGRYNANTDSWTATSTTDAPAAREFHTAVSIGSQMIIWGGDGSGPIYFNSGGRYCAQSQAPMVQSAVSRKTHGAAGTFDINLPLTGTPGIECRSSGATHDYTMVVTFSGNVTVTGNPQAQVTLGTGCVGSSGTCTGNVTVSGNTVTVPLTNIANAQTINVRINGVNGAAIDTPATDFTIPMSILIGDTNANATVNAADVAQTKARLGQTVGATNFRSDVNANGSINAADTAIVKQNSGASLPP